jgi:hypothetical protein
MGSVTRVLELEHQLTRFVRGDSILLRVDARLALDSAAAVPLLAGLFIYDSAFTRLASTTGRAILSGDTVRFTLYVPVAPGRLVYSAELMGDTLAPAARARHALDGHLPDGIVLSDVLVGRAFPPGRSPERRDDELLLPSPSLTFAPGDTVGLYAEVYRLAEGQPIDIEIGIENAGSPTLLGRVARWVGRTLGLLQPAAEPRISWRGEPSDTRHAIALNIVIPHDRKGLHEIVLRVSATGSEKPTESRRLVLIR